tara:strand:- start:649 stop:2133 length:1485 start_codon:yes stop_codon:yes gene_type:complete
MSIASGFESGFNMALAMGKFRLQEKEEERKSELFGMQKQEFDLGIQSKKLDIEKSQLELEFEPIKQQLEIDTSIAQINSAEALAGYRGALGSGLITEQADIKKVNQFKEFSGLMADMITSAQNGDEDVIEDMVMRNTPLVEKLYNDGMDVVSILSPETATAFRNLNPMLQSGNFENIGPSFANDLSQVYKGDLNLFQGKKFKSSDGEEGIIQSVSFNGDIVGQGNGNQAVLGATYSVKVGDEVKEYQGFLPDLKSDVISQDVEGVDAKAVSIADATDKMASLRNLVTLGLENPKMFTIAKEFADRRILEITDPAGENIKLDKVSARAIYQSGVDNYTIGRAEAFEVSNLDLNASLEQQENEVSTFINVFTTYVPNLVVETKQADDGTTKFVIPEKYRGNLGKYLASAAPSYADALQQVQNSPIANANLKEGQRRFYTFGTLSFTYNAKQDDYLPILENVYGKDAVNEVLSGAANAGAQTDEEILDLLYNELARK